MHGSPERDPQVEINSVNSPLSIMELNNQQLTAQLQALQNGMQVVEATINSMMPKMDANIQESKNLAEEIHNKLEEHINPIVKANVIDTLIEIDSNHQALAAALDAKIAAVTTAISDARDVFSDDVGNSKLVNDQLGAQVLEMNRKVDATQHHVANMAAEFADEKTASDRRYASTQSQIATMHSLAASSSGGSGGGRKSNDPLVCHKLIFNKVSLSGEEDYDTFDEWFIDMADDFEILIPGSKPILQEAEKNMQHVTMSGMLARTDSALVTNISR